MTRYYIWCTISLLCFALPILAQAAPVAAKGNAYEKMDLGQAMYFNGNIGGAIREFQAAVEINPKLWEAHMNLANMYMEKGDIAAVIKEYREILALKPNNKDVWLMLANLLQSQNDLKGAIESYHKAIEYGADIPSSHVALGLTLLQANEAVAAAASFAKAVAEQPDYPEAHMLLGASLFKGDEKAKTKALAEVEKAIVQRKHYPEAHNMKGDMLSAEGKTDEALAEYEKAVNEAPMFGQAWSSAANLYYLKKDYAKSAEDYARALEADPNSQDACYGLGLALEQQGRVADAITAIQHGLNLDKNPETSHKMSMHLEALHTQYAREQRAGGPIVPTAEMTDDAKKLLENLAPQDNLQNAPTNLLKQQTQQQTQQAH